MKLLEWDTEFWEIRVGLASDPDADAWAAENEIDAMWLLLPADQLGQIREAETRGWSFMDIRVEFERAVPPAFAATREWREDDLPALVALARSAHRNTRFYADQRLTRERCDDLYEAWIRNSCAGWARHVFVSDGGGYVTVHADGDTGSIGLIAVPEEFHRRGIGEALVNQALSWAHGVGLQYMTVATQGRNVVAQRLFQRCGFATCATDLWFRKWYGLAS